MVGDGADVWDPLGDLRAALAVASEWASAGHDQLGFSGGHCGEALALADAVWEFLAGPFFQSGFGIEEFDL